MNDLLLVHYLQKLFNHYFSVCFNYFLLTRFNDDIIFCLGTLPLCFWSYENSEVQYLWIAFLLSKFIVFWFNYLRAHQTKIITLCNAVYLYFTSLLENTNFVKSRTGELFDKVDTRLTGFYVTRRGVQWGNGSSKGIGITGW